MTKTIQISDSDIQRYGTTHDAFAAKFRIEMDAMHVVVSGSSGVASAGLRKVVLDPRGRENHPTLIVSGAHDLFDWSHMDLEGMSPKEISKLKMPPRLDSCEIVVGDFAEMEFPRADDVVAQYAHFRAHMAVTPSQPENFSASNPK